MNRSALILITVLVVVPIGVLQAQEEINNFSPSTSSIWAAGAERGAYLVISKALGKGEGFQIFFRQSLKDTLLTGKGYLGKPICVTSYEKRLLVFLDNGGCQSYQIDSAGRTEARLPPGLLAVAAAGQEQLYVLAYVQQSAEIELESSLVPSTSTKATDTTPSGSVLVQDEKDKSIEQEKSPTKPAADEKETSKTPPSSLSAKLSVQKGDYFIMVRGKDNQWRSLSEEKLPLADWADPRFAVHDNVVYLFGIEATATDETKPQRTLLHCRLEKGKTSLPQFLPIDNVTSVTALEVNRQLLVIAAVPADEASPPDQKDLRQTKSVYRVGWPTENGWNFTEPLLRKPEEKLSVAPENLAFAVMEQNLAAFEQCSDEQVRFGMYNSSGNLVQELTQNLATVKELSIWLRGLIGFFSPLMGLLLTALALLLVYRRRQDFLSELPDLPPYVQTASLGRRTAAAIVDLIPAWVAAYSLAPIQVNADITLQKNFWEESQRLAQNPELFKFLAVFYLFWIGYLVFAEILLSATPGKLIFQLIVLSEALTPLTPKEALVRNLLRLLEFHITMLFLGFFLALISRRRQRLGDLMARSIVVRKTPELQKQLIKMLQKKYFHRQQLKDSDSQDNTEDNSQDENDD
jgi:uncharacterized RDD family membrane protein YckC